MKFVYFGTPKIAVTILEDLKKEGFIPSLIVTSPDKPAGRKLVLTPSPVKSWAIENNIKFITPIKLRDEEVYNILKSEDSDLFIVAAYGKIIPQNILDIPKHKTINVHPSKLPLLRGPSPIESAITEGLCETTVSIMELDSEMDHGPIIIQDEEGIRWIKDNPPKGSVLEEKLSHIGSKLLIEIIPKWINGEIIAKEQDHEKATYCRKITKEDGLIDINGVPFISISKIRAYDEWPGAYFFLKHTDKEIRIKIKEAKIEDGKLIIERVIPDGKNEMNYQDFLRGLK
jgi:methionyl-tRNA formyltransferase